MGEWIPKLFLTHIESKINTQIEHVHWFKVSDVSCPDFPFDPRLKLFFSYSVHGFKEVKLIMGFPPKTWRHPNYRPVCRRFTGEIRTKSKPKR